MEQLLLWPNVHEGVLTIARTVLRSTRRHDAQARRCDDASAASEQRRSPGCRADGDPATRRARRAGPAIAAMAGCSGSGAGAGFRSNASARCASQGERQPQDQGGAPARTRGEGAPEISRLACLRTNSVGYHSSTACGPGRDARACLCRVLACPLNATQPPPVVESADRCSLQTLDIFADTRAMFSQARARRGGVCAAGSSGTGWGRATVCVPWGRCIHTVRTRRRRAAAP